VEPSQIYVFWLDSCGARSDTVNPVDGPRRMVPSPGVGEGVTAVEAGGSLSGICPQEDDSAVYARWRSVANGNRRVELTKEAYEEVLRLVEHPREPNDRLRAAMARHGLIDIE
jgi:hypothetical protein